MRPSTIATFEPSVPNSPPDSSTGPTGSALSRPALASLPETGAPIRPYGLPAVKQITARATRLPLAG